MNTYKCSVCNEGVVNDKNDWNEFNACEKCWSYKRDEVMSKRFPLLQTFKDALKINKLEQIKSEFTQEKQWAIDVDDVIWLIEQAEKVEQYKSALKFYANDENYEAWDDHKDAVSYFNNVDFDSGNKAKTALGIIKAK